MVLSFLDLARVLVTGLVLGLVVGRIVARRPKHLDRLKPRFWLAAMRRMKLKDWARLISISSGVVIASLAISIFVGEFFRVADIPLVSPEEYPFTAFERDYPLLTLAAVNILPIFEEWIFRGIIMDETVRWRRSKLLAVIVSAVAFSVFHLSNPGTYPAFAASIMPASLLLSACYLFTGLGGVIIAHNAYNTVLVLMSVFG